MTTLLTKQFLTNHKKKTLMEKFYSMTIVFSGMYNIGQITELVFKAKFERILKQQHVHFQKKLIWSNIIALQWKTIVML